MIMIYLTEQNLPNLDLFFIQQYLIFLIIIIILGFGLNITEVYKDDTENTSGALEIL